MEIELPIGNSAPVEACLAAFLFRYSGQEEIPFATWSAKEEKWLARTLPFAGEETFSSLVDLIAESETGDDAAQILLMSGEVEVALPDRFEVAFALSDDQLTLHYDAGLYREETMRRWADYFGRFLVASEENPEVRISEVEMLGDAERHQMLETWNSHSPESQSFFSDEPSPDFCLHRVFEKQVERTPDRPAAESHGRIWTYRELDDYANQIAHFLLARDVKPDERIGIYLDRSVEMLAALLGIMKSGGAYVPLDTALPRERLEYMASDSGARLVLTSADLLDEAPVPEGAEAVVLGSEEFGKFISENPDATSRPKTAVDSSNLIYVIYTSGSTGLPKGVMLGHSSVVNYLWSIIEGNELTADDVWFAYTTTAFDPSVKELFSLLFIGGKVVVGPKGAGADGETLGRLIQESEATKLFATPTTLRILIASGWQGNPKLDILSGGEAISRELANEMAPLCKILYNVYGPTETTIFNTNKILTVSDEPVTIGGPLAGCRLYVIDDAGNVCPPQVRGNLFIGGACLAHGYMNKPELTAEKFVSDPFSAKDGAKMYNTGDVAYWTPEGEIVFLGRSDHQVKIRGYRIELGEIEKVLEDHPGVQDSVVIVREDTPGQPRIVAYVIPSGETMPDEAELRDFMSVPLPAYMIPGWFVEIAEFPLTPSRKTDRNALPKPEEVAPATSRGVAEGSGDLAEQIAMVWAEILGRRSIRVTDEVYAIGADSLNSVQFQARIDQLLGLRLPIAEIFQGRTPEALAERIREICGESKTRIRTFARKTEATSSSRDIAIIGMSGRFPGAGSLDEFWQNLIDEVESIRDLSEEEMRSWGVPQREFLRKGYVARSGGLKDAYEFDNEFFSISPLEAELLSPQIRLFLKTAWEAMEDAGYPAEPENSRIGVYAGSGYPNYLFGHEEIPDTERIRLVAANGMDFMATRASYLFGLTGPSLAIQTACSTSLVAINEACESLLAGRCEMAIAGASSFSWPHERGHLHEKGMIYSADGRNRSFDANATGTVFTQGVGVVMLKPLEAALADGDHVHAVIRGVAVNNDGNRKNGYSAPSIEGQAEVISQALANARVSPDDISYLEAHATGTMIGDPIEVASLTRAWRESTDRKQFCALGSVKPNIGHADAAAGMAGLFKLVLSLKNREIPATIHLSEVNPELDIENSPFYLVDKRTNWQRVDPNKPLIGAVSSFGIGGTNAHLILEEAPAVSNKDDQATGNTGLSLFPFSAESQASLDAQLAVWPEFLEANPDLDPREVAHTLQIGRRPCRVRAFTVVRTMGGLREAIANEGITRFSARQLVTERKPVFLFTGQGSQYLNMARPSYENDSVFRAAMDRCAAIVDPLLDRPLLEMLFGEDTEENRGRLLQTSVAQPAIFAVSYAQAMRWMAWGIEPAALSGHSIGEYVAATLSGVMRLEDALSLVVLRGRLMQAMAPGRMLGVMRPADEVLEMLQNHPELDLAASNSPSFTVISGDEASLAVFEAELTGREISCKALHTSHAFHSRSMEPMLAEFEKAVGEVKLSAPTIPYPSNVSGTWITHEEATSPSYYATQVRSAVRFSECLSEITRSFDEKKEHALFLEMGPGKALTTFANEVVTGTGHLAISTLPTAKEATHSDRFTLESLGQIWAAGQTVEWERLTPSGTRRRVSLPTYRFDEKTFRSPDQNIRGCRKGDDSTDESLLHVPVWKQFHLPPPARKCREIASIWLCFSRGFGHRSLESGLLPKKARVVRVLAGKDFRRLSETSYRIRPGNQEDYDRLIEGVIASHGSIHGVLHTWTRTDLIAHDVAGFWNAHDKGAIGLLWLARSLGGQGLEHLVSLNIVTSGLMGVAPVPENHTLSGVASVIQREYPKLITKVIDLSSKRRWNNASLVPVAEVLVGFEHHPLIAHRDGDWWRMVFEPITDRSEKEKTEALRKVCDGGTYVFTGGLGGLSLRIAREMATQAEALDIVLINRSSLPPRETWDEVQSDLDRWRIDEIRVIEALGATVHLHQADLSHRAEVARVMDLIVKDHGPSIRGIFHTAGVNRDSVIAMKNDSALREVFASKALAALHLVEYAGEKLGDLDFLALFSSVSAELGYYGGSDYAAANAYLDGLAANASRRGIPAIAINWALWREVGMGAKVDGGAASATSGLGSDLVANSLSPSRGARAMLTVLADSPSARVAVFPGHFEKRRQLATDQRRAASLPKLKSGKNGATSSSSAAGSKGAAIDLMLGLWKTCLKNDNLGPEDNYFRAGGDSLAAISLIAGIEENFDQSIPMSYLISAPTVTALIEKMGLGTDAATDESEGEGETAIPAHVLSLTEAGGEITREAPNLFCVHGADGSVLFYQPFADLLKVDFAVHAIEAPMLTNLGIEPRGSIEKVAQQYLDDIRSVQPTGPYHFAGYSYGALVAWEMARLAQEQGDEVASVIIYDMYNPADARQYSLSERLRVIWKRSGDRANSRLEHLSNFGKRLGQLAGWAFYHATEKLQGGSGFAGKEFRRHVESRIKHDAQIDYYRPAPLDVPVAMIQTEDPGDKYDFGERLGWKGIFPDEVEITTVGGNHLEIFQEPNLTKLAQATTRFLSRIAEAEIPPSPPSKTHSPREYLTRH
ncbi:MAG: amino acid adenylation domain-containing protein [Verrucomicrobiae bacterium]|nr:amino acid adenylation domain-containing protein [Verrucomicrobiae bacterium]